MLTQWLLQSLYPVTATFFQAVHHIALGMQWWAVCSHQVVPPRHWYPHVYGAYEYVGKIVYTCKFWDRAGTMHPALGHALRALGHVARHVGRLMRNSR